ncbi:hypothetical protein [Caminibacter pacificus]|jgi:hypothetical protein
MAYEIIVNDNEKTIELHSDECDVLIGKKEDVEFNNNVLYITFNLFEEIEEFLKNHEDYEVIECEECKPKENRDVLDEEYDDFYEEFDEDEDIDSTRCDIF